MTNARENTPIKHQLSPRDYDIAGNEFRAYYDLAGKLVFVLDQSISSVKPNVLLVINPVGDRKWDDILANDYNIDLETVRPKKDNKYQKLDIEYAGLGVYDDLILASQDGVDLSPAMAALDAFRASSVRRAALVRLNTANETADKARETIERTNETIDELKARVKELRGKLNAQRRDVGREPTKQSAAKILRTEAQIDSTNEKLRRAQRRLINAQRRLDAAISDADTATHLLEIVQEPQSTDVTTSRAVTSPAPRDVTVTDTPIFRTISMDNDGDDADHSMDDNNAQDDPNGDSAVVPLLDQDPEIIDEKIAFRPIDFDAPVVRDNPDAMSADSVITSMPVINDHHDGDNDKNAAMDTGSSAPVVPLSFTPPVARTEKTLDEMDMRPDDGDPRVRHDDPINVTPIVSDPAPMIDSIMPMDLNTPTDGGQNTSGQINSEPADIVPAPAMDSDVRPLSPLGPTATTTGNRSRPSLIYYILLGVLIVLAIFTLWLYQRRVPTTEPNLVTVSGDVTAGMDNDAPMPEVSATMENDPFLTPAVVSVTVADEPTPMESDMMVPETVVVSDVNTAPVVEPEQDNELITSENSEQEIDVYMPAPTVGTMVDTSVAENAALSDVIVSEVRPAESIVPPMVSSGDDTMREKPAYNVSHTENIVVPVPPAQEPQFCDDGTRPDPYGCCTGEEYTDMGDGYACCIGNDCFPPIGK